jgi:lipopolysaccharide export system permease protein
MKLIERYIFRKIVSATALTFIALGAMVWLSQALRQFDLVTANGQAISTFLTVSALLVPVLVVVVFPVALLIAVIYTFNSLNSDSELVVINASGARQFALLKPVLLIGAIATVVLWTMTLYFSPLALRSFTELLTNVRGNIISQFMREGAFMHLADGLSFHMRDRNPDGSLGGIFVSDDREPDKTMTYLAEKGALLENPLGLFLIMSNGTIQQRDKKDASISMIEFSSYAFDLSSFSAGNGQAPSLKPMERPTRYLLNPDPEDPFFRQAPGQFRAEFHDRVTAPLYCFLFALVPLLFLGQAESARQSRTASITAAVVLVTAIRAIPVFLPVQTSVIAQIALYVIPIGGTLLVVGLFLSGVQLRPPERIVVFVENIYARASGLMGVRAQPQASN